MLKRVRFKNFRSFVNETIIDLDASKSNILLDTNVENDIVKGCCFYGANASGKTNALNAITLLLDLFFKDVLINPTWKSIFNNEKTMYFEYTFVEDNEEIVYYIEINRNNQICKETLTINNKIMLNRLLNSAESYLTENRDYSLDSVDEKTLFLKKIYFNTRFSEFKSLKKCFEYLKNSIYYNPIREIGKIVYFDPSKIKEIDLLTYLNENGTDEINSFFDEFKFPYRIKYKKEKMNPFLSPFTQISIEREELPDVPFFMESYGNQVLLSILPSLLTIVKNGGILAIDEFSSGLHNKLESLLLKYFFKHSKNAQIFFVSHSTNLLKTSLLRPDQIYSVDFYKGSILKKFQDEKPRESQNLEKMYLSGVFGGIPLYGTEQE